MDIQNLIDWNALLQTVLRVGVILLLGCLILQGLRIVVGRLEQRLLSWDTAKGERPWESQRRVETLTRLLRQAVTVIVFITLGLAVLMQMGVQVGPILASAGIIGLAVGFGAQNLVRDIISGFFLILENQVRVGDVVIVNGRGGLVEAVNFRTIVLRDDAGVVHVFPNGTITTLANMTRDWSAYVFNLRVAYKENLEHVLKVIRQVGQDLKADPNFGIWMLAEPEIFGVDQLMDWGVVIQGRIRTRSIRQWDVGREFLRRVKSAFDAAGIDIPGPYRAPATDKASQPAIMPETTEPQRRAQR